jgi:hypothetical protein
MFNRRNIIAFLVIILIMLLLIYISIDPNAVLAMSMLGNPFHTTRKMKVPMKSRVGHRERTFLLFARICWSLAVILLFAIILIRVFSYVH